MPADVRIVEPEQLDRQAADLDLPSHVRQILPAVSLELRDELGRPSRVGATTLPVRAEVGQVVQGSRCEVVVRAEHEPRCEVAPHRPNGGHDALNRFWFGEEVARHHRDICLRKSGQKARLGLVTPHEVQVAQVHHRERVGALPVCR
ncbi:MAG: hypothetical protein WEE66_08090 [Actinomycetota bacterium]